MFTVVQFTITMLWNQSRCPSTHKWIKKNVICIHSGVIKEAIQSSRTKNMSFAGIQMKLEIIKLSKVKSYSEKQVFHVSAHIQKFFI
jgi:tRNA G37 N-methylase Trm5